MLTALALAGGLCLSGASAAMADPEPVGASKGDAENPATAAITKILVMPHGTVTPNEEFTFVFTPETVDGAAYDDDPVNMPPISGVSVPYVPTDVKASDGVTIAFDKESGDFASVATWPHAGVYVYTVTEFKGANGDIVYSQAEYEVTFWVDNCTIGTPAECTTGLFVAGVGVRAILDDEGEAVEDEPKVDPKPGGDGVEYTYSQMIFTNYYTKTNTGDPEILAEHKLRVSKTVTGDHADLTKYFEFKFSVTQPATGMGSTTAKYKAYVVVPGGTNDYTVVTTDDNCSATFLKQDNATPKRNYCEVTSGTDIFINLKDGQAVVFGDLHDGATYTVVETGDPNYDSVVDVVVDGTPLASGTIEAASTGANLSTGQHTIGGAGVNTAEFLNTRVETLPTGLRLNDLPFVGLIVLGLAVLVLVTVTRRGKSHA